LEALPSEGAVRARLRHRYQDATDRHGRHGAATVSRFAFVGSTP
jgi:hypothetical protein